MQPHGVLRSPLKISNIQRRWYRKQVIKTCKNVKLNRKGSFFGSHGRSAKLEVAEGGDKTAQTENFIIL